MGFVPTMLILYGACTHHNCIYAYYNWDCIQYIGVCTYHYIVWTQHYGFVPNVFGFVLTTIGAVPNIMLFVPIIIGFILLWDMYACTINGLVSIKIRYEHIGGMYLPFLGIYPETWGLYP
jgi:hypothetical protein